MSKALRVLIGYDGSPCADAAIDDLPRAGLPKNVEAIVLSVADLWLLPDYETVQPTWPSTTLRAARESVAMQVERAYNLAEAGAARLRQLFPTWRVTAEAATDSPAWAIILKAESWGADLIVVGSHGYSTLERWMMGSVSHSVLTHARTSVRVARGRPTEAAHPLRILIGIDGSREAELAVRTVAQRQWPAGSDIRLIAVANPSLVQDLQQSEFAKSVAGAGLPQHHSATGGEGEIDGLLERMVETYKEILNDTPGVTVSTSILRGDPKAALLEAAAAWGADCIFLGSRGLNRWERLLLGSVSHAVATRARCPVEVIRATSS